MTKSNMIETIFYSLYWMFVLTLLRFIFGSEATVFVGVAYILCKLEILEKRV